ncbi:MAG: ATP-binding protein [Chitinophagaceae bacterium]
MNTKPFIFSLLSCLPFAVQAQQPTLEKIWQTDTVIAIPESVLPDFKEKTLYVSLIDGAGWGADGKGGVGKLDMNGKIIDTTWITGLNAPKGMARVGNRLYVADITEIIVIDIAKGKIEKKIAVEGALNLNDATASDKGVVYVSDSKKGRIYKLYNNEVSVYLDSLKGTNGVKAVKDDLYILSGKNFIKADAQKNITQLATLTEGGDGLEPVGNGDFIATAWVGVIYYIHANGQVDILMDYRSQKKNTADIGYDPAKRILYLPTFNGKTVEAFKVK